MEADHMKFHSRFLLWIGLAGLALTAFLAARGQPLGDQLNLLARGWLLAARGELVPFGNPLSTGGHEPGALTSLLVGLPLMAWMDARAPVLVVVLAHLLAWFLLDRVVRETLGGPARVLLAVLFWLNPWRVYLSGFLWNPNYLFVFGAMHLWSARAQAERPRFWASAVQALAVGLAFQLHASFILLAVASFLLWWRGYQRLHWAGLAFGGLLAAVTLVPWALALAAHPEITEAGKGFLGRGLVTVHPVLRGLGYWVRYASFAVSDQMLRFDFTALLGAGTDAWLAPAAVWAARVLGAVSAAGALAANIWLWRKRKWGWARRPSPTPDGLEPRAWMEGYAMLCLAAAFAVYCLAPTTIMFWQGILLFHASLLPPLLWCAERLDGPEGRAVKRAAAAAAAAGVLVGLAMGAGAPQYRCGGRGDGRFPLRSDSPLFQDLRLNDRCPWPMNTPGGWWPDVLPEEGPPAR
jgi:hypothetical protein